MKKLAIAALALLATPSLAQVYVPGYVQNNGTYVQPHYRSAPNANPYDNYSTRGNINPYTGKVGTVNPYQSNQNAFQRNLERSRSRNGF